MLAVESDRASALAMAWERVVASALELGWEAVKTKHSLTPEAGSGKEDRIGRTKRQA
jgi:hypothetical protein